MAERKRRFLGCSFPILIVVLVVALVLLVIGFLSGGIGQKLLDKYNIDLNLPSWLIAESPAPHLPAPTLFHVFGLPITNTIIAGWITIVFLVLVSWLITRRMQLVPGRAQSVFEFALGWIFDFCVSVAGKENGRKFFTVVCTIFLFVIFNAWLSLIPGFASIEQIKYEPIPQDAQIEIIPTEGSHSEHKVVLIEGKEHEIVVIDGIEMMEIKTEFLRGANTDVNTPLAIALVSFIFVAYYGLATVKLKWVGQYFNFGPFLRSIGNIFKGKFNFMDILSGVVNAGVGLLELLSMFIRIISFTFRLFGNMTAGEILIMVAAFLLPMAISWAVYGLELLVGFIQALVFSGLTLAFASMAVTSHEEEAH
jgi:F-type H+-transporting ATPase subunit a